MHLEHEQTSSRRPYRWYDRVHRFPKLFWQIAVKGEYQYQYDLMPVRFRRMAFPRRFNLLRAGLLYFYRALRPLNQPLHMMIELTNYCDLRCPVCPVGTGRLTRPARAMEVSLFRRLWEEVSPGLLVASLWGWGEPLLHPGLGDILRIADGSGVMTILSTNGQALQRAEVRSALLDHPPTYLIVALDGLTRATNSLYRTGGNLEQVLDGVRLLREERRKRDQPGPLLHLRFIAMRHNIEEIPRLPEFGRIHGFDFVTLRTLCIIDGPDDAHRQLTPEEASYRAYRYEGGRREKRNDFICRQPFWFPIVYTDGTVGGCDQDYNATLPLGKLNGGESFRGVWSGPQAALARKTIRDLPGKAGYCLNCPYTDRSTVNCSISARDLREGNPGPPEV